MAKNGGVASRRPKKNVALVCSPIQACTGRDGGVEKKSFSVGLSPYSGGTYSPPHTHGHSQPAGSPSGPWRKEKSSFFSLTLGRGGGATLFFTKSRSVRHGRGERGRAHRRAAADAAEGGGQARGDGSQASLATKIGDVASHDVATKIAPF